MSDQYLSRLYSHLKDDHFELKGKHKNLLTEFHNLKKDYEQLQKHIQELEDETGLVVQDKTFGSRYVKKETYDKVRKERDHFVSLYWKEKDTIKQMLLNKETQYDETL